MTNDKVCDSKLGNKHHPMNSLVIKHFMGFVCWWLASKFKFKFDVSALLLFTMTSLVFSFFKVQCAL